MLGESNALLLDCGAVCVEKRGKKEEVLAAGKHLVGHGVLVGEPLAARQVFVHRRNDLQDVVV